MNTEPSVEPDKPTSRAIKACAEWLSTCVRLGWPKLALDDLEKLWWEYHDNYGEWKATQ